MIVPPLVIALALPSAGQDQPDRVTVALDEFLRLYEEGKNRPDKPEKAPVDHALASARFVGEVIVDDGEPVSAVFQARMKIDLLEEGWASVPLLPATVAVRSARIGGAEAPLTLENGYYTLITDERGQLEVLIDLAVGVHTSDGQSGFAFELVPSGATEVELAVPASDALDFQVANARLVQDRVVGARRVVQATLPSTGSLAVTWQKEIPEAAEQQPRVYSEVHTLAAVGEGLLSARVTLNQTILFHGVDRFQAKIPDGMTVLDVGGAGLRDWDLADGTLTALLNYEAEGSYQLTLGLERVIADGAPLEVPLVQPIGVERSKGWVGVQSQGTLELNSGAVSGAAAVDVRTLPATILGVTDQPVLLGFKYLGTGARIPLEASEHEEVDVLVTLLDQANATTMFTADGRRLTAVKYQVRNNRRQFLRLAMPEGAELWSAAVAGKSVQPARGGDGRLLVPLVRSQASGGALAAFVVEVVYVESGEPPAGGRGTFRARLPLADAPTTYVGWTVYAPWDAKVGKKSHEGALRHVESLSRPLGSTEVLEVQSAQNQLDYEVSGQLAGGALGEGAAPVTVSLPLDGQAIHYEKLLALTEELWVSFDYRGVEGG